MSSAQNDPDNHVTAAGHRAVNRGRRRPLDRPRPSRTDPVEEPTWSEGRDSSTTEGLVRLSEALKRPELLKLPEPVVARIAWSGRTTLFAGREKFGKSTLATAAAAAGSTGTGLFLESGGEAGRVLYYNLEEHIGDLARRFERWQAEPHNILIRNSLPQDPLAQLREDVKRVQPQLVVIDSLTRLASPRHLDPSNGQQWGRIMEELERLARVFDVAFLIIHHSRKSDNRYRDSTAIGGGVDVILEMHPGERDNERRIKVSGRFGMGDFAFRLLDGEGPPTYELIGKDESLNVRIKRYLRRHPGASTREVRENVRGTSADIADMLEQLEEQGVVENRGAAGGHEWSLVGTG